MNPFCVMQFICKSSCIPVLCQTRLNETEKENRAFPCTSIIHCGPGSSVDKVTELRAGRSGDRIPVGTRFSTTVQTGPGAHPASCKMGTGSFPGGKVRPGRAADHSPPSSAAVMEEQSYTSTQPLGQTGPVMGSLYLYLLVSYGTYYSVF